MVMSLISLITVAPEAMAKPKPMRIACVRVGDRLSCRRKAAPPVLRLCPHNPQMLCVVPKGDVPLRRSLSVAPQANQISWQPVASATHYAVSVSGYDVNWQQTTAAATVDLGDMLQPGNAYTVDLTAYRGDAVVGELTEVVNVIAPTLVSQQP